MRHRRSEDYEVGARLGATADVPHWTELSDDPNAPSAVARRAAALRAAWRPPVPDRVGLILERCRGRRVLDIGCVAHDVARMQSPHWLHGRIAAVAERCVGVDVLPRGIEAMRDAGFEALEHDLREGLGPVAEVAPVDVVVAGELIEHIEALGMLFDAAAEVLSADGELILTTPNPYAPRRVRAAQLGIVWENVDHIVYAFPSGMAELADRHGLVLAEAMVTADRRVMSPGAILSRTRQLLRGRRWLTVGYASTGRPRTRRVAPAVPAWLQRLVLPRRRFLGETFVYVLRPRSGARR